MSKAGFIAIVGRPNAGKSTLLNSILGMKVSIVTPKAQTTRERVLGILTEKRGQIVFVDTPGIHKAKAGGINEFMVSEAREALEGTSAIWYLVDPNSALEHENAVLELLEKAERAPLFLVMNKFDLKGRFYSMGMLEDLEAKVLAEIQKRDIKVAQTFRLSAETGKGVSELLDATWKLIPEHPAYYPDEDQLSDRPTKFFVAEKVRELLIIVRKLLVLIQRFFLTEFRLGSLGRLLDRHQLVLDLLKRFRKIKPHGIGDRNLKVINSAAMLRRDRHQGI